ncbi:MAG: hypothetical protein JXA37_07545 [Chloroflexia bacterium]|nr:hypothetical protein [Chloroflexia bacterium]
MTDQRLALEFVDFCMARLPDDARNWGRLYDEMCHVASRNLFRGLGYLDLSQRGVSLSLGNVHALRDAAQALDERFFETGASSAP